MRILLLLAITSAALLGIVFSETGCALPTTMEILERIQNHATSKVGLQEIVTNLTDHHYTCQAVGNRAGQFRYLSIAVKYSVTRKSQVDVRVSQIQLECNIVTGNYRGDDISFEGFLNESLVFSIPTRRDCRVCTAYMVPAAYDADANCAVCSTSCLEMGQGACTNDHGTDCCPYFGADGMCLKNCSANTVTKDFTCAVPALSSTTTNTPDNTVSDTTATAVHFYTSEAHATNVSLPSLTSPISTITSSTPSVGQGCTVQTTVAALLSGTLSAIATSLIAGCIMWCVVLRGRQKRRDTSPGVQQGVRQQKKPSTELVEYEVPVLHEQIKDVLTTQSNVAYGEKISLQQNVSYEQVHVHQ